MDEEILVVERRDACGFLETISHFGPDFVQNGWSDAVLSDQFAVTLYPRVTTVT